MWEELKGRLKRFIPEESFKEWFESTEEIESSNGRLLVGVPSEEVADFIKDYYWDYIVKVMKEMGVEEEIDFVCKKQIPDLKEEIARNDMDLIKKRIEELNLNPDYTFDNFVVGPSNELAFATCKAVAEEPGVNYNPLYIYGDTGLGKTHLLHAVAHRFCEIYPDKKILLVSAERFFHDYVSAVRSNNFPSFRERYRELDVLLVDDIQFLAHKEGTREEFFNTFNDLFDRRKQIVISSDSLPGDIYQFQDRLVSRFKWGIIADIQPPDLETRIAILFKKAKVFNLKIEEDAVFFIAKKLRKNVRELEGALKKCGIYANLKKSPITVEIAKESLKDILEDEELITPEKIMKLVADYYRVPVSRLKDKNNSRSIVVPRQVAMYLCKQLTNMSYPEIGRAFGNKHHTTVMYACSKVEEKIASDPRFRRLVDSFTQSLR